MEKYYNAGYYLIKKQPYGWGALAGKTISTCCQSINIHAFGNWAFNSNNPQLDNDKRVALGLNNEIIQKIQKWAYHKLRNGLLA